MYGIYKSYTCHITTHLFQISKYVVYACHMTGIYKSYKRLICATNADFMDTP